LKDKAVSKARDSFWTFAKLMNPSFYKDSRPHLRELCDTLQALAEGRLEAPNGKTCRKLAISEPPRHGKSYTMNLFNQWCFGRDQKDSIINVSYNEKLSGRFSKGVRDGISATRIDPRFRVFADVFPGVKIKDGDAAAQLWSLDGSFFSFLGAGMEGTITGVGCKKLIIDDPIKNHLEAYNQDTLEAQWEYYTNTLLSRVEEGGIIIIVMTRWAMGDLVGRVLAAEPDEWYELNQPACLDEKNGRMLCPELLSFSSWKAKKGLMADDIFKANFQNTPMDKKGCLYEGFATYSEWPTDAAGNKKRGKRVSYTDTADTGADYLCMISAEIVEGQGYVMDVIYTDEPMEKTEKMVARSQYEHAIDEAVIESNNGGRGFGRNVERILWETFKSRRTKIIDKNQRQNKESRILTEAPFVMRNILFPEDWARKWPLFYKDLNGYQRKGKNAHDDAPDCATGLAEYLQRGAGGRKQFPSGKGARRF
jgi:predicted phage terminase large subunit-like protein